MNHRYLACFVALMISVFAPIARSQTPLERPVEPAPSSASPVLEAPTTGAPSVPAPASNPAPAPAAAPAPAPLPMPPPPEPPQAQNPLGLIILGIILAHVCLPLGMIVGIILIVILVRFFRGGLMKLAVGAATAGGGIRGMIKGILITIGCLIVLPSGFMGLNWATRWMDYRVSGPSWWIYGLVVSVVTGLVFYTLMKAIGRVLKKQMMGRMGGMMGGMGGMGGFPNFGEMMGQQRELRGKKGGKKRRFE